MGFSGESLAILAQNIFMLCRSKNDHFDEMTYLWPNEKKPSERGVEEKYFGLKWSQYND